MDVKSIDERSQEGTPAPKVEARASCSAPIDQSGRAYASENEMSL